MKKTRWLNSTVLGIGLASLFSDWSHEIATAAMPAFLAALGVGAVWLGIIEGVADGLSSFAKLASGFFTDRLQRRKPIAVAGYAITALCTAAFALATNAWHILLARSGAWLGRGVRTPVKKALLAAAVPREAYARAFGLERAMDTVGAIIGPITALFLLQAWHHNYRLLFAWTIGLALLGVGVVGAGLGTYFGLTAKSTYDASSSNGHCLPSNECDDQGKRDRNDASTMAVVATAAFGIAAVAMAAAPCSTSRLRMERRAAPSRSRPWRRRAAARCSSRRMVARARGSER